jgi:hypothetical protein
MASSRSNRYAICVRNDGHTASLDLWKVYRQLQDKDAERDAMVRIVDNEEEDYLYPADWFIPIDLPAGVERRMKATGRSPRRGSTAKRAGASKS